MLEVGLPPEAGRVEAREGGLLSTSRTRRPDTGGDTQGQPITAGSLPLKRWHEAGSTSRLPAVAPSVGKDALPPDFAGQLARLIAPGEEEAVSAVLSDALLLDDLRLGSFLERFAARVQSSAALLTGAELRGLLSG